MGQCAQPRRILQQAGKRSGQMLRCVGFEQEAAAGHLDQLRKPSCRRLNHRHAGRHGLEQVEAKSIRIMGWDGQYRQGSQKFPATGAIERPIAFAGNDVPGVMLASAVRDYAINWAVAAGQRVVVATNNDDAYRTALALHGAGVTVVAVADVRARVEGPLPERVRACGIPIFEGRAVRRAVGGKRLERVELCLFESDGQALTETFSCDALAVSGVWSPAVHLWCQP